MGIAMREAKMLEVSDTVQSYTTVLENHVSSKTQMLQNAMFIGIDCFHDIVNRRKSVAGFVSSINQELTQWFSQCIFQELGQELVNGLKTCLEAALKLWCKHNQFLLQAIIVYRDGVGNAQLQALMDHEVPQIESSLKSVYPKDSGYINCKVQIV
ncbi:piwi-like protein 3 [Canis lupus baileyi]|uniref:piwi-like protein 3 n=1 Tax=Canis lupus baileyi TaxID=143281 RepID=UPI003B9733BF